MIRNGWRTWVFGYLVLAVAMVLHPTGSAAPVLRFAPVGAIYEYRWQLLALALAHTPGGRGIRLVPYPDPITQSRALELLKTRDLDVLALGTSPEREASAQPVRIDILKGIVGLRLLLIRAEDQDRLDRMDDERLRREITFGLQRDWADLPIMTASGFRVEVATDSENLFKMLAAGRFDAFPRGLNEVRTELAEHAAANPGLALEANRALYFPYPVYFWVRRGNTALAARIERGLRAALADGSFRRLFLASHGPDIAWFQSQRRKVLVLPNPLRPAGSLAPDTSWWWPRQAVPESQWSP
jgi:hypothetical protein